MTWQDLPEPQVVQTLSYEAIVQQMLSDLQQRWPQYSALLPSDPAVKIIEVAAYRELLLRHRINAAAQSQLLVFATGSDLDHLAAFYGVERLADEDDEALRSRVRARIMGFANAGGAAHYRYWALSASALIQDVAVTSPAPGVVRVCVLPRAGADAQAVVEAVRAQMAREDVRVLTDTVEVVDARIKPVQVRARLWRLPGADEALAQHVRTLLRAEVQRQLRLGWDLMRSWIVAQLHRVGVHSVELVAPAEDVPCEPHEAVQLVDVHLEDMGVRQ